MIVTAEERARRLRQPAVLTYTHLRHHVRETYSYSITYSAQSGAWHYADGDPGGERLNSGV